MPTAPSEQTNRGTRRTDMGRANRLVMEVPVHLREGGVSFGGVTRNIGPGGVFVATLRPLGVGTKVVLALDLDGDTQFVELDDRPAGVGLRFIDTPLRAAIVTSALRRSRLAAIAATKRR
jgi:hypothetical protein